MSNTAIDWAEQQPTGSSGTRQLLVTLANAASDQATTSRFGKKWPPLHAYMSIASMCERTLQDRKTVMANLKRLKESGFIRAAGTDGATNQTVVFCLAVNEAPATQTVPESAPVPDTEPVPEKGSVAVPELGLVPESAPVPILNTTGTVFPTDQYRFSLSPVPKAVHESQEIPIDPKKKQKSTRTTAKRKTPMSEDWQLSEKLTAWTLAERPGLHIAQVLANFRDHHLAKGELRADWDASWRTWVRREREPMPGHTNSAEPAWRGEQRERMQKAAPYAVQRASRHTGFVPERYADLELGNDIPE